MPPSAVILSIGDELVSGLTTNTNASWLGSQLATLGIHVHSHVTVGDDLPAITDAIQQAATVATVLIISGGLGPTEDDVTRQALANALNVPLVEDPNALEEIATWFKSRQRLMTSSNRVQALRPETATTLPNTAGTAPGLRAKLGTTDVFVVPGVPREMKEMFTRSVLPHLQSLAGDHVMLMAKLNTFGLGESYLGEKIKDLMTRGANPAVGTTVHDGIVSVRVYSSGPAAQARQNLETALQTVRSRLGPVVYSQDNQPLEAVVAELLLKEKATIATAESCTAGLVAQLLTNTPGSSAYLSRGWVTYSNQAKTEEIDVPESTLAQHGAVSEPVALAMAQGARTRANTRFALSLTGIAGPDGGSADKPVGTVWIGLVDGPDFTQARKFIFPGSREQVRLRAAQMALTLLRLRLLNLDWSLI